MENPDMDKQQAVLGWMQILCHLGVTIPLDILFNMFTTGQDLSCGSGILCLFEPWIRDPGWVKILDPG
jgi:hypothetical protein